MSATLIVLLVGLAAIVWLCVDPVRVWRQYRGVRLVTCPETEKCVSVTIDSRHAAWTALTKARADLHLASCSRWPARGPCDEQCLPDLLARGPAARIDAIVSRWYAGKTCVYCGNRIANPTSTAHPAAVIGRDGLTQEWRQLPAERVPEMLERSEAVCWNCHLAESFRREHPDLYVDRH